MADELPQARAIAGLWPRCKAAALSPTARMIAAITIMVAPLVAILVAIAMTA